MRSLRWRQIVAPPPDAADRVFYTALWFKRLTNARYADLLPRLGRVDALLLTPPEHRVAKGLAYRGYRSPVGTALLRAALRRGDRRWAGLLTTEFRQLRFASAPVVVDVDDARLDAEEARLLGRPNVRAYVVTTEAAARRYEALGVSTPWHVIPQGVSLDALDPAAVAETRDRLRRPGELAVGYVASLLFTRGDPDGDHPLYSVDHLLDLWEAVRARVPEGRLWLLGQASGRLRERLAGRDDVLHLGWLPRDRVLSHIAALDVALYPRRDDVGLQALKVAEYLGAGVPTVSYDLDVVSSLRGTGAAVLVSTATDFVEAVVALARDPERRAQLAGAAQRAGAELDWRVLAARYEGLLDRYLPPR